MEAVMHKAIVQVGIVAGLVISGAAAADTMRILPGEWEVTSTMKMQTMPNVPPKVAEMMRARQGKPMVMHTCITPEDAARGPETRSPDKNCKVNNASYGGGRFSAESVCNHEGDISRMKMIGTYTPTSYVMDGQMSGSRTTTGATAMTMHLTGKRVAAICSAKSK
jgi:hypothetical protein